MKLEVPHFRQGKNACGPASLRMVLSYYGVDHSESEIIRGLGGLVYEGKPELQGSLCVDNALYARRCGFEVSCYTYNMKVLPSKLKGKSTDELKPALEDLLMKDNNKNSRLLTTYLQMIDEGVDLQVRMPSFDTVRNFIDQKVPVILSINPRILYENKVHWRAGHFIVITGYEGTNFYFNCSDSKESSKEVEEEKLFFSLANNALDGSGYLIAIRPRK